MYLPKLKGVSPRSLARPKAWFRDGNPVILIPRANNLRASALKRADGNCAGTMLGCSTLTTPFAQHLATRSPLEKTAGSCMCSADPTRSLTVCASAFDVKWGRRGVQSHRRRDCGYIGLHSAHSRQRP